MVTVNAYLDEASFGSLSLAATYVYANVDFNQATCGDYVYLDSYGDQAATSVDTMCRAAAEAQGYALAAYDFHMTVIPYCDGLYWGGIAYVGLEYSAINLYGGWESVIAHELGPASCGRDKF